MERGLDDISIRCLRAADAAGWVAQRHALWPEVPIDQLETEVAAIADDPKQAAFGAFDKDKLVAFAELSLHPHAIGCDTSPVAYLEAWRVDEAYRRQGVGAMLIAAGEAWGRGHGCGELASDTWIDNDVSDAAHRALGFEETDRLVHYRKRL
ncbi:MAG: GNAT family N-acetyltransferase [Phycisphaerales bacterium]|nr:GNAT family N-acetyltransferase [Phycisphaerales bacterium]